MSNGDFVLGDFVLGDFVLGDFVLDSVPVNFELEPFQLVFILNSCC